MQTYQPICHKPSLIPYFSVTSGVGEYCSTPHVCMHKDYAAIVHAQGLSYSLAGMSLIPPHRLQVGEKEWRKPVQPFFCVKE